MNIPLLSEQDLIEKLKTQPRQTLPFRAFYSSLLGGITTDPRWMLLPIDDHMVHRGDGVFEAIKFINQKPYLLMPHLERLQRSAERISLKLPFQVAEIKEILTQALKAAQIPSGIIRMFVSRGPGDFTTNPYSTVGSQLYIAITDLLAPAEEKYQKGVRIAKSQFPAKQGWMAQVKSCNYLLNVLMKKESMDQKLDFTVSFDLDGNLAESSTENIVLINREGVLVHPSIENILHGTTMRRLFELVAEKNILKTEIKNIREEDLLVAKEVMMVGTTLDILPVAEFNGKKYASFDYAKQFRQLILSDQKL